MSTEPLPLVIGIPGTALTPDERCVLERVQPSGIVLFSRNIESPDQVRALVSELGELDPRPFISIDLEGGAVNRLAGLWGTLPSPARAAAKGRRAVRALGEAAGAACRALGIHLDLAPVVDLERPEGLIARQSRSFSDDPERIATLAQVFVDGLATWCVHGCIKHFPGLGAVTIDTHDELPMLALSSEEIGQHSAVFASLSEHIPIVMVAHVVIPSLGETDLPASLSRRVVAMAAALPGSPVVLSDDLEMGALAKFGDLPERVLSALKARNHGVLVCKEFHRMDDIVAHVESAFEDDPTLEARCSELSSRLGTLRRDLCHATAAVPAPDDATVAQLWDRARREAEP